MNDSIFSSQDLKTIMSTRRLTIANALDDAIPLIVTSLFSGDNRQSFMIVARDSQRLRRLALNSKLWAPDLPIITIPAWDCQPYDRVSPHVDIMAERLKSLRKLARHDLVNQPVAVFTTISALLQKVPGDDYINSYALDLRPGQALSMAKLTSWFSDNGFLRVDTVREKGEFAIRGGIIDAFTTGMQQPVRIDFFGHAIESIRTFDAETQISDRQLQSLQLLPVSEVLLNKATVERFRNNYLRHFSFASHKDPMYVAIGARQRFFGMEHWAGFFNDNLTTIFAYIKNLPVVFDNMAEREISSRLTTIDNYYNNRLKAVTADSSNPYRPAPPSSLYLNDDQLGELLSQHKVINCSSIGQDAVSGSDKSVAVISLDSKKGRSFAPERGLEVNVFDAVVKHINELRQQEYRLLLTSHSEGSAERLRVILSDHGLRDIAIAEDFNQFKTLPDNVVGCSVADIDAGFTLNKLAIIDEQDIIGSRLQKMSRRQRSDKVIHNAFTIQPGDLVVHYEHGIGRFMMLKTIEISGNPRDFLEINYANNSKLYLPVENVDLLSRYGSADKEVALDKLGGAAWQGRRAKAKKRIRQIASTLIATAAKRALQKSPVITPPPGLWDEFCARFLYQETDDQLDAIEAVNGDFASGRPMDRLICGDVGFGKTEVALRAAFVAAINGYQVAILAPTTLLARQHYKTFSERFVDLPLKLGHISRLVASRQCRLYREQITTGDLDIVIGTHALLAKSISFSRLGLLVIDEEQHFGVRHKERLKQLKTDVNVLTLTATPIPRTLQLAFAKVRDLSLIATQPVDRLAVRNYIGPFDALIVKEALLREKFRLGQIYYVVPRISDLMEIKAFLEQQTPELKVVVAHGQLSAGELDNIMTAFYDGAFDVLLSTSIVESGLDNPRANTLIVHRADRFGLAQLYQLRGRVGRSKLRAYALFTYPANRQLNATAHKRLEILNSLDSLGAGFQLASYDLDLRGAGNLLGQEQSGHIQEIGFELYQNMLEEEIKQQQNETGYDDSQWSPQINLAVSALIPDDYIPDLGLRLSLYRRLADIDDDNQMEAFAAELIDRFGRLPLATERLLKLAQVKNLCKKTGIDKVEAGHKGMVISFRGNNFAKPERLIHFISQPQHNARLRPDHKLAFSRDWRDDQLRITSVINILAQLHELSR